MACRRGARRACPRAAFRAGAPPAAPPSSTPPDPGTIRVPRASGRAPTGTGSPATPASPASPLIAGSRSVLRVDAHVFGAEIARPHARGSAAARAEVHFERHVLRGERPRRITGALVVRPAAGKE